MNKYVSGAAKVVNATVIGVALYAIVGLSAESAVSGEEAQAAEFVYDSESHVCMSLNIYYEARGSNLADKAGVADVVLNRANDRRYPNTVCEVVKQGLQHADGSMKRNKCQFSWYCDGKHDRPQDQDRWHEAQLIAYNMLEHGKFRGITEGATHYHATYVNPSWAKTLQQVGRLGAHIYYRWE